MISDAYVLGPGNIPIPEQNPIAWARFMTEHDRHVAWTEVSPGLAVSTVFLGLDHQYFDGPPLLFETMVFGDYGDDGQQFRYATWDEAQRGHDMVVRELAARVAAAHRPIKIER